MIANGHRRLTTPRLGASFDLAQKSSILSKSARPTDWLATLGTTGHRDRGDDTPFCPGPGRALVPADEYHVSGLTHHYGSDGLGVPVVAHVAARGAIAMPVPRGSLLPRGCGDARDGRASWPASRGAGGAWHGRYLTLILNDPFDFRTVEAGGKAWPLAADRTTALAVQVNRGRGLRLAAFTRGRGLGPGAVRGGPDPG